MKNLILFLLISFSYSFAQEKDITNYLKRIESGDADKVEVDLQTLKAKTPNDPSIIFLEAILTDDGMLSTKLYEKILAQYPTSRYADASAYRLFSYSYMTSDYDKSIKYYNILKNNYSTSSYTKTAAGFYPIISKNKKNSDINNLKGEFTIQAGAFVKEVNAINLKNTLIENGYNVRLRNKNIGGVLFYIVLTGSYEKREQAVPILKKLSEDLNVEGKIVPKD